MREESLLDPYIEQGHAGLNVVAHSPGRRAPAVWNHSRVTEVRDGSLQGSQWGSAFGVDGEIRNGLAVGAFGLAEMTERGWRGQGDHARTDGGLVGTYAQAQLGRGELTVFAGSGEFLTEAATSAGEESSYPTQRVVWGGAVTQSQRLGRLQFSQYAGFTRTHSGADRTNGPYAPDELEVALSSAQFRADLSREGGAITPRAGLSFGLHSTDVPAWQEASWEQIEMQDRSLDVSLGFDWEPVSELVGSFDAAWQMAGSDEARVGFRITVGY
jgi:hypothetical protein